jgi:hypothetical protein
MRWVLRSRHAWRCAGESVAPGPEVQLATRPTGSFQFISMGKARAYAGVSQGRQTIGPM